MIVKHVLVAANFATGWGLKTNTEDISTQDTDLIREGNGLEPHLLVGIVRLVLLKDRSVHRCQVRLVHVARHEEHGVSGGVRWEGLVQWIVSHHVRVLSEAT